MRNLKICSLKFLWFLGGAAAAADDPAAVIDDLAKKVSRDIYFAKYYGKGGGWSAGEQKLKLGVREKNEKGKEKRGKLHLKREKRP